jgi:hypothetical protein
MAQDANRQRNEDSIRRQAIVTERQAYYRARQEREQAERLREERYRRQRADERKWQQTMESRRNSRS